MMEGQTLADELGQFGEVSVRTLSKVARLSAASVARSATTIPHVTHHDEIDVTDLEARRRTLPTGDDGKVLTLMPFLIQAVAAALRKAPTLNSAFDEANNSVVECGYVNVGVVIDTPRGLLVGVIPDADGRGVVDLSAELSELTHTARGKGLPYERMVGGTFTISSLGAFGGVGFTPIIFGRQAGILGVSRLRDAPRRGPTGETEWRQILPLSLSYDHRLVNGLDAGRFFRSLESALAGRLED